VPKSVTSKIRLWKQRHAVAATIIRLMEGFRDDYLPGLKTQGNRIWPKIAILATKFGSLLLVGFGFVPVPIPVVAQRRSHMRLPCSRPGSNSLANIG
jgi:hypothetical protein